MAAQMGSTFQTRQHLQGLHAAGAELPRLGGYPRRRGWKSLVKGELVLSNSSWSLIGVSHNYAVSNTERKLQKAAV